MYGKRDPFVQTVLTKHNTIPVTQHANPKPHPQRYLASYTACIQFSALLTPAEEGLMAETGPGAITEV